MRLRMSLCLMAFSALLPAQDVANPDFRDSAAIPFFHRLNPDLVYFQTFYRKSVDDQHSLLLIRAGAPTPGWRPSSLPMQHFLWLPDDLLGVFVQETARPDQVWEIAIVRREDPNWGDKVEVDRAGSDSIVLRLSYSDYGLPTPWLKLFFDISSKRFLGRLSYRPVAVRQATRMVYPPPVRGSPIRSKQYFVGSFEGRPVVAAGEGTAFALVDGDEQRTVLQFLAENPQRTPNWGSPYGPERGYRTEYWDRSVDLVPIDVPLPGSSPRFYVSFQTVGGERRPDGVAERTADGYKLYPIPHSTLEEHRRARPEKDEQQGRQMDWTIEEKVGPYFIAPGYDNPRTGESIAPRFWFAKTFYDGEGLSGVGGVGYFDTERREYVIFSPPELSPWSASALGFFRENESFVGLVRHPEGGSYSGGLLRLDTSTGNAKVYEVKEIILLITPVGAGQQAALALGTTNGIYVISILRDDQVERYVIEPELDGSLKIIAAPPPE